MLQYSFNSGINIIDKVIYSKIDNILPPKGVIDVVINCRWYR